MNKNKPIAILLASGHIPHQLRLEFHFICISMDLFNNAVPDLRSVQNMTILKASKFQRRKKHLQINILFVFPHSCPSQWNCEQYYLNFNGMKMILSILKRRMHTLQKLARAINTSSVLGSAMCLRIHLTCVLFE